MDSQDFAGASWPFDGNHELTRVVAAVEAELNASIEVFESGVDAPQTPIGGRLVRLTDRAGEVGGWLRITPKDGHALDAGTDGVVRVVTQLVGQYLEQRTQHDRAVDHAASNIRRVLTEASLWTVYQPICDLYDGSIVGYEALSRFPPPPQRTPDRWFGEAASVGLGPELETLAVRRALTALAELPSHIYLSVNVSPAAAVSPQLAQALEGVAVERLVLEITEHAEVEDYEVLNAAIARLRRRGARLAVDDTGAGFASMRHVLRLAPDIVKLDTTLTQDIDNDSVLRALGFSLKSFAAAIDAQVIAEGIETEREVDALRFLGVRYGQGFYLSRPGPLRAEQVLELTTTSAG